MHENVGREGDHAHSHSTGEESRYHHPGGHQRGAGADTGRGGLQGIQTTALGSATTLSDPLLPPDVLQTLLLQASAPPPMCRALLLLQCAHTPPPRMHRALLMYPLAGFGVPNRRKRVFILASMHGDARDVLLSQVCA